MKTYIIPVTWEMHGKYEVRAESLEEALKIIEEQGLPKTAGFVPDSMKVNKEEIKEE